MPSMLDPFCPSPTSLFFNCLKDKEQFIHKFTEKIEYYAKYKYEQNKSKKNFVNIGSSITAAIYSGYDSLKNNYITGTSKIFLFSANKCAPGIIAPNEMEYNKYYSSENEIKLFLPQV